MISQKNIPNNSKKSSAISLSCRRALFLKWLSKLKTRQKTPIIMTKTANSNKVIEKYMKASK